MRPFGTRNRGHARWGGWHRAGRAALMQSGSWSCEARGAGGRAAVVDEAHAGGGEMQGGRGEEAEEEEQAWRGATYT